MMAGPDNIDPYQGPLTDPEPGPELEGVGQGWRVEQGKLLVRDHARLPDVCPLGRAERRTRTADFPEPEKVARESQGGGLLFRSSEEASGMAQDDRWQPDRLGACGFDMWEPFAIVEPGGCLLDGLHLGSLLRESGRDNLGTAPGIPHRALGEWMA